MMDPLSEPEPAGGRKVLSEKTFRAMIAVERKRTERSKEPFLLMLVQIGNQPDPAEDLWLLEKITSILLSSSRETDVVGWYTDRVAVGALFTGLAVADRDLIRNTILNRLSSILEQEVSSEHFGRINVSFHFFPDDWSGVVNSRPASDETLYPDLMNPGTSRQSRLLLKRMIDFTGSAFIMILCFPLFLAISLAVKVSSKGPILFKQVRVGQYGRRFVLYKFRTMYTGCDTNLHKEYVTKLIADQAERKATKGQGEGVYKLTDDKRITRVGKFLRRSSLDELPQILNVLKGDMSLVGPRPAIPYEVEAYQTWHRRRVLEAKPGVTGLWQVTGRSLVRFDDMVRLDLRYATSWSLLLDFKILLRTPRAVFRGAY